MGGRDPHERGRVATPLELLFDLTFVVAFSYAGNQMAHQVAAGHAWPGIIGFCFAMFGICWAWINFTWFASAFDTDDWFYRLVTMVQMIGVVIFAVGLPTMFHSMEEGHHIDNRVMVLGYVVMRVAMLAQWVRAGRQSPPHSRACRMYAATIFLAQLGWVILALLDTSVLVFALAAAVLILIETGRPAYAEARLGGTPWHPHHIAERYGLLAIITLGEGVVGAVVSLEAATAASGWDWAAASFVLATMGLTFGLWWIYFAIPFGELLHHQRQRSFVFGYGHMVIFGAIAATGAGLHVLSYYLEGHPRPRGVRLGEDRSGRRRPGRRRAGGRLPGGSGGHLAVPLPRPGRPPLCRVGVDGPRPGRRGGVGHRARLDRDQPDRHRAGAGDRRDRLRDGRRRFAISWPPWTGSAPDRCPAT